MFRDIFQKQPDFMTDICLTDRKLLSTVLSSPCIILSILIVRFIGPLNVIPVTPVVDTCGWLLELIPRWPWVAASSNRHLVWLFQRRN